MKKWKSLITIMSLSLGVVGCGVAGNQTDQVRSLGTDGATSLDMNQSNGTLPYANTNMNDQKAAYPGSFTNNSMYKDGGMGSLGAKKNGKNYGYATYTKRDMNQQQASTFYVDRNVLARGVATVVTSIPGIEKANVLVTDEDVIITLSGVKDKTTLNQAKLSAWSLTPRYYNIYITSDENMMNTVHSLVNRSPQKLNSAEIKGLLKDKKWMDMTGTPVMDKAPRESNS